jgi:RNA polymerase sigma-70 factor (ECF subfamily)
MAELPSDASDFRALYDAHGAALRHYAQRIVRSRETAEDVVQDVFLRLWRSWGRVEIGLGTRAYLYIATRARALSYLERERSAQRRDDLSVPRGPRGITAEGPALPPEGEATLEADAITRAIEQVLAGMPPRQREVATLRLRHQASTAEIAWCLGISPRTVECHIARATRTLRRELPGLLDA